MHVLLGIFVEIGLENIEKRVIVAERSSCQISNINVPFFS